jgi:hypothetical protein
MLYATRQRTLKSMRLVRPQMDPYRLFVYRDDGRLIGLLRLSMRPMTPRPLRRPKPRSRWWPLAAVQGTTRNEPLKATPTHGDATRRGSVSAPARPRSLQQRPTMPRATTSPHRGLSPRTLKRSKLYYSAFASELRADGGNTGAYSSWGVASPRSTWRPSGCSGLP